MQVVIRGLICIMFPAVASACSCLENGPTCEAAWKASVVFAGTVVELTRDAPETMGVVNGFLGTHSFFEVSEGFIGMQGRGRRIEIRTGMGGGDCGYPFRRSQSYVVYAFENAAGTLVATICSRTAPEGQAQADLEYLRRLPASSSLGYVFGIAGMADAEARFDKTLGVWMPPGISGVTLTLTGLDRRISLVTLNDGSFRFNGIPPGKYEISVAKDGYLRKAGTRFVEVHDGGCAYAWETLALTGGAVQR